MALAGGFLNEYSGFGQTCYPAVAPTPGTPAQVIVQNAEGWNAGARSIDFLAGDGTVSFNFAPSPIGVVAGLVAADQSTAFNEATHAVYAHGNTLDILESGVVVATSTVDNSTQPTVTIQRIGAAVTYIIGSFHYTSTKQSGGPVYLDAALYLSGDYVDNPQFAALSAATTTYTGDGDMSLAPLAANGYAHEEAAPSATSDGSMTLPAFTMLGAEGAKASGDTSIPALTLSASASAARLIGVSLILPTLTLAAEGTLTEQNRGDMTLPAFQMMGGEGDPSNADLTLPALTVAADGGFPAFTVSVANMLIPALISDGAMLTGSVGNFSRSLPALEMFANEGADRGAGTMSIRPMIMYADDGPLLGPGEYGYGVMEFAYMTDRVSVDPVLYAIISDGLELQDEVTFLFVVSDSYYDGLTLSDSLTFSQLLYAIINDGLAVNSGTTSAAQAALQYATNVVTGALSTYQNFDFLGFARAGMRTLAFKADGLYEVTGSTDNGSALNALIDFGVKKFGTNQKKHIATAFLGLSTDGTAYLRLTADSGAEKTYRIVPREDIYRAFPAKGITAREWRVKLELTNATSADLDSVEYVLNVTPRHWTR